MAFQRVPNTAEISVVYDLFGMNLVNTYHAYAAAGYNQSMLDTLAAQIDASPVVSLLADQATDIDYVRTDVRGLDQENDLTSTNNTSAAAGGAAATSCPSNIAFCVQRLSGLTGRSARGRVYIGGIPFTSSYQEWSDRNLLTVAAADAYVGHVDGFRSTIEAIGPWDAVIVSRYNAGSKRATGVTFTWTQTQYSDRRLDTQRRRMI